MPKQSPFRIIKRCRLFEKRGSWDFNLPVTRGIYVLYEQRGPAYNVKYIGVGGTGNDQITGIFNRLKNHARTIKDWTHYSFFEVHDNVTKDEILELETLFLTIFRHDINIKIVNKRKGSKKINAVKKKEMWKADLN